MTPVSTQTNIYLADLTYTQQGIQSEIMPNAIGCLATYATKCLGDAVSFELFKRPDNLLEALSNSLPDVVGFSTYTWNFDVSYQIARAIKSTNPDTIVVFGGPNYPTEPNEQIEYLTDHECIDFFVEKEGEIPFTALLEKLIENRFNLSAGYQIPAVHSLDKKTGEASLLKPAARINNLSDVPSPYLNGLLDEFFADGFMPIIQTKRGCPFSCTFCVEGVDYYTKISRNNSQKISDEIIYIGEKMAPLIKQGKRGDLFIADSNFAMFTEDLDACRTIRLCQDKYNWPQYISVATGKNKKERVIEAAGIVRGAIMLAGSVQSLDPVVLQNIKRKNVSADQVLDIAKHGAEFGANTITEVILGLPGDSRASFERTLSDLLEMNFNRISIYTLMLLPGAELNTLETREKYGFQTKYRVIPKCFGYYDYGDQVITAGEIEEVVVASDTLSFEDYQECRVLALLIEIFFNDGMFELVHKFIKSLDIPLFDLLKRIRALEFGSALNAVIENFSRETREELWADKDELEEFLRNRENIDKFISGDMGNNVIYKFKSLALVQSLDDVGSALRESLIQLCTDKFDGLKFEQERYISELVEYCTSSGKNLLFDFQENILCQFQFDFENVINERQFENLGDTIHSDGERKISFVHDENQCSTIAWLIDTYGSDISGITRLVTRAHLKSLLRQPVHLQ